ncbi:MAG: hypothetical protein JXB85_04445 [Anaerolineales bacterium]|nr:hypothetical protein [Anaerolineales bacterium]
MISNEKMALVRVVERFVRTGSAIDDRHQVVCLPDNKTSFVEPTGSDGGGRSVLLDEFKVDGRVVWAGYSGRSETIYLSEAHSG